MLHPHCAFILVSPHINKGNTSKVDTSNLKEGSTTKSQTAFPLSPSHEKAQPTTELIIRGGS